VQTFAALAVEGNVSISKYIIDEIVHGWFLEFAALPSLAREIGRSLDFFGEEITNICPKGLDKCIEPIQTS
jgi:hypothetical protein